jgi:putative phosphoribosyl transferase
MQEDEIQIPAGGVMLNGTLGFPATARGMVLFAHGSGSGRQSPRNRFVASILRESGLATLLMDLLTAEEELEDMRAAHLRFNIGLLAERLVTATDWLLENRRSISSIGYFGSSTGAAAALIAAAERPAVLKAVVSRGGRPDLALKALPFVQCPVLLIVGGNDHQVLDLNKGVLPEIRGEKRLEVVPDATHLFEEPGALDRVALLAGQWFLMHFPASARS